MFSVHMMHSSPMYFIGPGQTTGELRGCQNRLTDIMDCFFLVLPRSGGKEGEESNRMYYYPKTDSIDKQTEITGFAEAVVNFTDNSVSVPGADKSKLTEEIPFRTRSHRYTEQTADLLGVKSFKRKYADMTRRVVEVPVKEYIQLTFPSFNKTIGEHQMYGMTALRAIEVRELMANEYPSIYAEYQRAAVQKIKAELAKKKEKAFDAIKNDKSKLEELRKKAMKNASEFNSDLAAVKKTERKYFWELQTSTIQSPSNRWMVLPPERTRPHLYPCSLITGQYQNYYKQFTPSELRRLPLNSVLDGHHLFPVKRPPSPPPIIVKEDDLTDIPPLPNPSSPAIRGAANGNGSRKNSASIPITSTPKGKKPSSDACALCNSSEEFSSILTCSSCSIKVHSDCIDMPDHIVEVAESYEWHCIECKRCTICAKPDNEDGESSTTEDKLMFCDRCDRGYHTFCVGLQEPPTGLWECDKFCGGGGGEKVEEGDEGEGMEEEEEGAVVEKRTTRTSKNTKSGPPPKKKMKKEVAATKISTRKSVKVEEEVKEEDDGETPAVESREEEGESSTTSKTESPDEGDGGKKGKTPRVKEEKEEVTPLTATRRSARKIVPKQNRD